MDKLFLSVIRPWFSPQGLIVSPTASNSVIQRSGANLRQPRPFAHAVRLAVVGQSNIDRFIVLLLSHRRPAAITRIVMAVIVDPIDRMLRRRARPHVAVEPLEIIRPLMADRNASRAVARPRTGATIKASRFHRMPYGEFRRICQAMRAVSHVAMCAPVAATANGQFSQQQRRQNSRGRSALATANPFRFLVTAPMRRRKFQHSEPSELLAG